MLGQICSAVISISSFFQQASMVAPEIQALFLKLYAEAFICEMLQKQ